MLRLRITLTADAGPRMSESQAMLWELRNGIE